MVYFDHVASISTVGMPFFARIETIHHDYASLQKPLIGCGNCQVFINVTLKVRVGCLKKLKLFHSQGSAIALAIALMAATWLARVDSVGRRVIAWPS